MALIPADGGDPELTVVMVSRGAWSLTQRATSALVEHTDRLYELIVVDNASGDETRAGLTGVHDAHVLRYPNEDGSLQEAAALLARDGTVMPYGAGHDPALPCYRFQRTVDYGSAACTLVRRDAFAELGGFDDRYAPAYYEDVNLCLRLAQTGPSTVFEPRSTVTHSTYEGFGLIPLEAAQPEPRARTRPSRRWVK